MLCCSDCKVLLTSQTGLSHVRNCHAERYEPYPEAEFSEICSRLGIRETYPLIEELEGLEAISGLYMHTMALVCAHDDCGMIFSTKGSMRKHYSVAHDMKGNDLPKEWNIVFAQQLDHSRHRTYFRVKAPPHDIRPSITIDWIDEVESDINRSLTYLPFDATDTRNISTFLLKTRWPEHVNGLNLDDLRTLVSSPDHDEFPYLKATVNWIVDVAMNCLDYTALDILQRLNTKDFAS